MHEKKTNQTSNIPNNQNNYYQPTNLVICRPSQTIKQRNQPTNQPAKQTNKQIQATNNKQTKTNKQTNKQTNLHKPTNDGKTTKAKTTMQNKQSTSQN